MKKRSKKERNQRPVAAALPINSVKLGRGISILVCLAAILSFLHTLSFAFVWDDEEQILRNPWIRDWSKLLQFFATDVWAFSRNGVSTVYYRPLHMVAHAVGYQLSGFEPQGYHLINILLHAACPGWWQKSLSN